MGLMTVPAQILTITMTATMNATATVTAPAMIAPAMIAPVLFGSTRWLAADPPATTPDGWTTMSAGCHRHAG